MGEPRLLGRDSELAFLRGLVDSARAGAGAAVLVEGEQGIGKSALLRTAFAGAAEDGFTAFWASAGAASHWLPPLEADCVGARRPAAVEAYLRRFGPVLVVAEDMQWADEASVADWRWLSRAVGQLPLLLVGSMRPGSGREDLHRLRQDLLAHRGSVLTLRPLSADRIADLVRDTLGGTPGPRLAGLLRQAGGNPLYACELAESLVREGRMLVDGQVAELAEGSAHSHVPASMRTLLKERLRGLPADVVAVLRQAALIGLEFTVLDLQTLTGFTAGELVGVVEAGGAAGLLTDAGSRLGFRHALIRQFLYEEMSAAERAVAHLEAARSLAVAGTPPERVAAHLVRVLGTGTEADPMSADSAQAWVPEWLADSAALLTYRSPEVAAEVLRAILRQLPAADPRRDNLEASLVAAAHLLMRDDEVEKVGVRLLDRGGDPEQLAEIAWLVAFSRLRAGKLAEGLTAVDDALSISGIRELRTARLRALRALLLVGLCRFDEAALVAQAALAEAEPIGDRLGAGYALHVLSKVDSGSPDRVRRLGYIDHALLIAADDLRTADLRVTLLGDKTSELALLGRQSEAISTGKQALALAEQTGTPRVRMISTLLGQLNYEAGNWDDAHAELGLVSAGAELDRVNYLANVVLALIHSRRNHWDEAAEHLVKVPGELPRATPHWAGTHYLLLAWALRAEEAGRPADAAAILRPALEISSVDGQPGRHQLLTSLVRLSLAVGDTGTAAAATRAAASDVAADGSAVSAIVAMHCRGLVAGDPEAVMAAARNFETAGRPLERAQALEDAAVLAAVREKLPTARRALTAATELYVSLGAQWDAQRAAARIRPYGVRPVRADRRRSATGWGALTPTELRVAQLVAAGRSNPEIAAELYLSRNTVQTHVSHILAKFGARSRAEIVVSASRRQSAG